MQRPLPRQEDVAKQARELSDLLQQWLGVLPNQGAFNAGKVKQLIDSLKSPDAVSGWDEAAQLYLALQPLRLSLKDLDPAWPKTPSSADLAKLLKALRFPDHYDSPKTYDPTRPPGND
jgi:hypothetical protein